MSIKGQKIPNRKTIQVDFLDEFPPIIRQELKKAKVKWPPKTEVT